MQQNEIKVIQLVHHDFEDLELWYPVYRLREIGVTVHLIGESANTTYIGKYGVPAVSDYGFDDLNESLYDAILVPGGWAPDKLRRFDKVLAMIKHMNNEKKLIGTICHGGWVLASAGILEGRRFTSTPGIKDDMINAGVEWVNESAVTDANIVSAQRPPDLPNYMRQFVSLLQDYQNKR